jgi:hypothetical protein
MQPSAYLNVALDSLAGGATAALIVWNRNRNLNHPANRLRNWTILALGSLALTGAFLAFRNLLGTLSPAFTATTSILTTCWSALAQSSVSLPLPRLLQKPSAAEYTILRQPWTGVRLFGKLLRKLKWF